MADCKNCGAYTKYDGGLCIKCFKNNNDSNNSESILKSISERKKATLNKDWVQSLIKGRIAETIVEQLFLTLGFQVFKYGMENTIPGIKELLKSVKDDVAMEIKRMPDFVIFKDNKAHFIEVKYRKSESFKLSELEQNREYPYANALIVLVSQNHIKCISYQELKAGKEITPNCHSYLGNRKEFDTDKEIIKEYCQYAVKFFENV